jgi:hypothetical protein
MDILRAWLKREGSSGRKRLQEALEAKFPGIHPMSITDYKKGNRIPDKARAEIMAEIMGVPLEALSYRYNHKPGNGGGGNQIDFPAALRETLCSRLPGVPLNTVYSYLRGHRVPDKATAEIMAELAGVPVDALPYRYTHVPQNADDSHGSRIAGRGESCKG